MASQLLVAILSFLLQWGLFLTVLLLALGDTSVLVLLIFRDQIVHVGLCLGEFHLVHTLTSVPMQESLASEHGSELIADTLEKFLDRGRVSDKGRGHLQTTGRDGAESRLDVVGDPFDEVRVVLALNVAHLVLHFLHANLASEDGAASQVSAVSEIGSCHHVLGVEHLLGELRHGDCAEGVGTTAGERSEPNHEEVQTREWHHVDGEFAKVGVELARESQASCDTRHDCRNQVVQIAIRWIGQLEGSHTNVVKSLYMSVSDNQWLEHTSYLIVNAEGLVGVLNQLMD